MKNIAVLVASLRSDSHNMKLANCLEAISASAFKFHYAEIGNLPHYNEDLWAAPPENVIAFKRLIEESDVVLIVTPEYNRGIPGVLKNALDWGSRPWGKSSWRRKPASLVGISLGTIGTAAAQSELRSIMLVLDLIVMGQPEVYLSYKPDLFDEEVGITNEKVSSFLRSYVEHFDAWIDRVKTPREVPG
jgi:chromate reductase